MSDLRRKALHTAATVVLAMGCVIRTDREEGEEGRAEDSGAQADSGETAWMDLVPPEPGWAEGGDSGDSGEAEPPSPASCLAAWRTAHEEVFRDCCSTMYDWCEEHYPHDYEARVDCSRGLTGCSPWGPPVPPAARHQA